MRGCSTGSSPEPSRLSLVVANGGRCTGASTREPGRAYRNHTWSLTGVECGDAGPHKRLKVVNSRLATGAVAEPLPNVPAAQLPAALRGGGPEGAGGSVALGISTVGFQCLP